MLLYTHPINDAREARGALPVNSFWLSGCGAPAATASGDEPQVDDAPARAAAGGRLGRLGRGLARAGRRRAGAAWPRWSAASRSADAVRRALRAAFRRRRGLAVAAPGRRCKTPAPPPCWRLCERITNDRHRDTPPRAVWALEQAGVHPLLARLFAARGVRSADELDDGLARLLPPAGLKGARRRPAAGRRDGATANASASSPTTTATAPPPAPWRCAACACSVRRATRRLRGARPRGARLRPHAGDRRARAAAAARRADHGGQRHRQPRGRGPRARAGPGGAGDRPPPAGARAATVLPDADVIVNPNQPGCTFASKNLAGVGVMFYVLLALRAELRAARRVRCAEPSRGSMRCSTWWRSAPWPTW